MIPEVVSSGSLLQLVRHRSAFLLKTSLLFQPGIVVTNVPLVPGEPHAAAGARPVERPRSEVDRPGVERARRHRARVVYAKSLQPSSIEAIHMATDPEEIPNVVEGLARPADGRPPGPRGGAVPRPRASVPGGDPEPDGSRGHGRDGGPSRAGAGPLVAEPAAQPVGAVLQADAAVRAGRRGDERPVPPVGARDPLVPSPRRGEGAQPSPEVR